MTITDEDFLKKKGERKKLRSAIAAIIAVNRWDKD